MLVHRAQPLAVDRTRILCDWFFHPDALAAPGFDPQPAIDFWDLTNRQDWELCANAYKGVTSNAWQPGPYSELESQLAAFDRQYLRTLDAEAPVALAPRLRPQRHAEAAPGTVARSRAARSSSIGAGGSGET